MLNKKTHFTFLLSHKRKNKISIRRLEVPKKYVQNGFLGLAFAIGATTLGAGAYGISNYTPSLDQASQPDPSTVTAAVKLTPAVHTDINYSRPNESDKFALNTGGPAASENALTDAELESRLQVIETTSNQAYIPNIWAVMGKITNEFGFRRNPFGGRTYEHHAGMDIAGDRGDPIIAPANGKVVKAGWQGGYGNLIEIDHQNGLITRYGHLSKIDVSIGDDVTRGQLIGLVGSTGRSTGPHLHYELRIGDRAIDPRRFLPPEPTDISK